MDGTLAALRRGPLRILVVEDHADTLEMLGRMLQMDGHDVVPAGGFQPAVRLADSAQFDVLLADIQLGDGCGWALMKLLRQTRPELVGIAMTGHGTREHRDRSTEAGYCAHLTKPIDFRKLREAIQWCTQRTK